MDDLISRQAAIENIKECAQAAHSNYEWDMEQGYINAIECLEELPSAQPERKKGEWIEISLISHSYKCSECGRLLVNITDGKNNVARNYPYCHCGADMRGE